MLWELNTTHWNKIRTRHFSKKCFKSKYASMHWNTVDHSREEAEYSTPVIMSTLCSSIELSLTFIQCHYIWIKPLNSSRVPIWLCLRICRHKFAYTFRECVQLLKVTDRAPLPWAILPCCTSSDHPAMKITWPLLRDVAHLWTRGSWTHR